MHQHRSTFVFVTLPFVDHAIKSGYWKKVPSVTPLGMATYEDPPSPILVLRLEINL